MTLRRRQKTRERFKTIQLWVFQINPLIWSLKSSYRLRFRPQSTPEITGTCTKRNWSSHQSKYDKRGRKVEREKVKVIREMRHRVFKKWKKHDTRLTVRDISDTCVGVLLQKFTYFILCNFILPLVNITLSQNYLILLKCNYCMNLSLLVFTLKL